MLREKAVEIGIKIKEIKNVNSMWPDPGRFSSHVLLILKL